MLSLASAELCVCVIVRMFAADGALFRTLLNVQMRFSLADVWRCVSLHALDAHAHGCRRYAVVPFGGNLVR